MDPYCNLTDGADMAVPVFGPIALDEVVEPKAVAAVTAAAPAAAPASRTCARRIAPAPRSHPSRSSC